MQHHDKMAFFIEVCGTCNLKCVSCPQGNSSHGAYAMRLMDFELFRKIVAKIGREHGAPSIHLYNWGEPLLHPRLPEMVDEVNAIGSKCFLSSNLNRIRNLEEVLKRNPYVLRISLSGFTQPVYVRGHVGGDIEKVRANMEKVAEIIRRTGSTTRVHAFYHRYRYNLDEVKRMEEFARSLGFGFHPVWALLMPAEKVIATESEEDAGVRLSARDRELMQDLCAPVPEVLEAARRYPKECSLQDGLTAIDPLGNVQLCCAVYDSTRFRLAPFLESSHEDLQAKKHSHAYCGTCMKHGAHKYVSFQVAELDEIVAREVGSVYANQPALRWERFKKKVFHKVIPKPMKQAAYDLYVHLTQF